MNHLQDAASLVAGRLHLEQPIPTKLIRKVQSSLRVLKFKHPIGSFGTNDNDLKRACALLEYMAREEGGIKIPTAKLARAAYMKEKEFKRFHELVGNFRSSTVRSNSQQDRRSQRSVPSATKSSIPTLAIKLSTFVQDSNGVALRAQKLFDELLLNARKQVSSNSSQLQVRDIGRNQRAYEAACLYLVATNQRTGDVAASSKSQDEEDNKQLQVSTIVDLSTDFTSSEFKSVLEHVTDMRAKGRGNSSGHQANSTGYGIKLKGQPEGVNREEDPVSLPVDQGSNSATKGLSGGTLSQHLAATATQDLLKQLNQNIDRTATDEDLTLTDKVEDFTDNPLFLEWRRRTISDTLKAYKSVSTTEALASGKRTENAMLKRAAMNLVESYNNH